MIDRGKLRQWYVWFLRYGLRCEFRGSQIWATDTRDIEHPYEVNSRWRKDLWPWLMRR